MRYVCVLAHIFSFLLCVFVLFVIDLCPVPDVSCVSVWIVNSWIPISCSYHFKLFLKKCWSNPKHVYRMSNKNNKRLAVILINILPNVFECFSIVCLSKLKTESMITPTSLPQLLTEVFFSVCTVCQHLVLVYRYAHLPLSGWNSKRHMSFYCFERHTIEKVNKANSMLVLLRRNVHFLDIDTFVPQYKTLVRLPLWVDF
jgi:hypothetical protein